MGKRIVLEIDRAELKDFSIFLSGSDHLDQRYRLEVPYQLRLTNGNVWPEGMQVSFHQTDAPAMSGGANKYIRTMPTRMQDLLRELIGIVMSEVLKIEDMED